MANGKDDTYYSNKIKNDQELLSGKKETDTEKIKEEREKAAPKPGQLFTDFVSGKERQDIEKPGNSHKVPESKEVKTGWADKIKNDREHE